ncbi:FHA domain-containing protein, partial [Candidatus Poribacteria bacterium]
SKRITRIGRAKGDAADICIDENTISGVHAQIEYKDHDFYLIDMQSRNGTYLDEERQRITSEVCLKGDSVIYFDQYKFKFVIHKENEDKEVQLSASPSGTIGG